MNDIVSNCDRCGKIIPTGTAYICLTRNIEQIEHSVTDMDDSVEILHSDLLISLCSSCGNKFNTETLVRLIHIIPDGITVVHEN